MSGGYIDSQQNREHQVVLFTFKGTITAGLVTKWNDAILDLKKQFGDLVTGVTIKGQTTKPKHLKAARKRRTALKRRGKR